MHQTFGFKIKNTIYFDRVGAYLLCVRHGLVAVVQTPKGHFLPGGGVTPGETLPHCIERELMEETGYAVQIERYFAKSDEYCFHEALGFFHPIQYYYIGRFVQHVQPAQETSHPLLWVPLPYALHHMYAKTQAWAIQLFIQKSADCLYILRCTQLGST